MKFISFAFLFFLFTVSCTSKKNVDPIQTFPPYKCIIQFSKKMQPETGLVLRSYGYNLEFPKGYEIVNGIDIFQASYSLGKAKNDEISLENARNLIVYLAENFLHEINSNLEIRSDLDVYPFTSDLLDISIRFEDENRIHLGQGVAIIYFSNGKIKYKGYKIKEYTGKFPAHGKHYSIHEETYAEALDIVKKQGTSLLDNKTG